LSPTSAYWEPPVTSELDEIDQLIQEASQLFLDSSIWEEFVPKVRDDHGDNHPAVGKAPHPAAHLLIRFRIRGAPVARSGTTWTFAQEAVNLTRGPRHSARQHIPFLHQEFVDMIRKGQWTLLPARLVLNELQLRLSPLGVVISLESTTINWLYPLMSACSLARHCGECSGNSNRLIFIWGLCIYPRSTLPTGFTVSGFE
jgi:hypothetical protein